MGQFELSRNESFGKVNPEIEWLSNDDPFVWGCRYSVSVIVSVFVFIVVFVFLYSAGDLLSVRDGSGQWSVGLRMIRDGGGKNSAGGIMRMIRELRW